MVGELKKIFWTEHSKIKMRQYSLSKSKLLKLFYKPERKEQGIAFDTTALMQTNKSYASLRPATKPKKIKPPGEIWLMYKDVKDQRRIISVWRYPGISKPGENIPIPQDILNELSNSDEFKQ